jgi:hypothetical protein
MQQDQMALQSTLEANRLNQQANQFEEDKDFRREENKVNRDEQKRQFEVGAKADADKLAWERDQAKLKNAEDLRRFDIGQQAVARQEKREERQLTIEDFRRRLDERRTDAELGQRDVQTQVARAQLSQYTAAAEEKKKADASRAKRAMTSMAGLLIATELNDGVAPPEALAIFNKEAGDKNNYAVGMGRDPETGLAFVNFESVDPQTGKKAQTTRNMTPENQYAALYEGLSKDDAEDWHSRYTVGSSARASSNMGRIKFQEKEAAEIAKEQRKLDTERNDPGNRVKGMLEMSAAFTKIAGDITNNSITPEQRKDYQQKAAFYANEADRIQRGVSPQQAQPKPFAIPADVQTKYGIPPEGSGSKTTPTPDGGYTVSWKDKGQMKVLKFAPGEW